MHSIHIRPSTEHDTRSFQNPEKNNNPKNSLWKLEYYVTLYLIRSFFIYQKRRGKTKYGKKRNKKENNKKQRNQQKKAKKNK